MAQGDGTYLDERGYLRIGAGPLRGMRVHTLVAMAKLGRPLRKDEVAHHKDENKANPHPDNIEIWDTNKHNAHSAKQYWFLRRLKEKEEAEWREWFGVGFMEEGSRDVVEENVPF